MKTSAPIRSKSKRARIPLLASVVGALALSVAAGVAVPQSVTPSNLAPAPNASQSSVGKVVQHRNDMCFAVPDNQSSSGPLDVGFYRTASDTHSVSAGQPWGGVSESSGVEAENVLALAGRHPTSPPAQFFKNKSNQSIGTIFQSDWGDLNFAFTGTLVITGPNENNHYYPIVLGQGTNLFYNHWMLGVPEGWTKKGDSLITPDGKFEITWGPSIKNLGEDMRFIVGTPQNPPHGSAYDCATPPPQGSQQNQPNQHQSPPSATSTSIPATEGPSGKPAASLAS